MRGRLAFWAVSSASSCALCETPQRGRLEDVDFLDAFAVVEIGECACKPQQPDAAATTLVMVAQHRIEGVQGPVSRVAGLQERTVLQARIHDGGTTTLPRALP